jgi:patatin-like phospholipase/acyl hydrolase
MIKDINVYLWEAMRASSAAPVYYKPLEMKIGGKDRALIDAGLFVMSPTFLAWREVQKLYPCRRLLIVSIASGALVNNVRKVKSKGATAGNIPSVLKATIETALEGQQLLTDELMQDLPNTEYRRLSFDVISDSFDDFSQKNIQLLENAASLTVKSEKFKTVVNAIVTAHMERLNDPQPTIFTCSAKEADVKKEEIAKNYFGTSSLSQKKQK